MGKEEHPKPISKEAIRNIAIALKMISDDANRIVADMEAAEVDAIVARKWVTGEEAMISSNNYVQQLAASLKNRLLHRADMSVSEEAAMYALPRRPNRKAAQDKTAEAKTELKKARAKKT